MSELQQREGYRGASLAIIKDRRLVYAGGFGRADDRSQKSVSATSLFRIASISKPLTAAAILQLAERKQLRLEEPVWDKLAIEPFIERGGTFDRRIESITALQLLQHTAGFDRSQSWDPMLSYRRIASALGVSLPIHREHILRYALGQPLDFAPGSRFAYSNFGYVILGQLIENITGESYEAYVQREVLKPLGIINMRVGGSLPADRADDEVMYFDGRNRTGPGVLKGVIGRTVPRPYGVEDMEVLAAAGGWIGSAVDLVKFGSAFDSSGRCPILKPAMVRFMFAPPTYVQKQKRTVPFGYQSCGWHVRLLSRNPAKFDYGKGGLLPGSSTQLVCRADGVTFAVLFNMDVGESGRHLAAAIEGPLHETADSIRRWPTRPIQIDE